MGPANSDGKYRQLGGQLTWKLASNMDEVGAVAIIGMSCRFAGCENLEEFWRILYNGENHVREIPPEKWNVEAFFAPNFEEPGKTYCKWAGLIDKPLEFDNVVFGINEIEATVLDPQQRLALEVSYKAIENAGIPLQKLKGSNTAVYMCQMNEDYSRHLGADFSTWRNYEFTGSNAAILSNRLSYTYDLRGPSVTVDTACSGAMVAVHMGMHSILSGESNMAVCGGSNFIIGPSTFIALSKSRMATTTGQCRAFSDSPDGYVKGEGCGIVLLKSLDKALQDNDRIWGILKTSICSDGRAETPITSPSRDQLKVLIADVVRKAKVDPADIQYVECHGTGTASGDPCEAWGVGNTYGEASKKAGKPPIPIGSVKTNIGHPESSAGTAGLIKVLLQMYHGMLVPSLHAERLNPNIDFEGMNITVSRERRSIGYVDKEKKIRLMGVNSNGFGGTAVHAIVQMREELAKPELPTPTGKCKLPVVFSALTQQGLRDTLQDTLVAIQENTIPSFLQLSNTSTLKRTHHNIRFAIFPTNLDETTQMVELAIKSKEKLSRKINDKGNNMIFAFCGMGSHWVNMGLDMYKEDATFKKTIDKIQSELDKYEMNIQILDCFAGKCDLTNPLYGQPAIFSVQVGLFETLKAKGIKPDVILGHSVGEVAAAYASGHLNFENAVKVIYERGRVLSSTTGGSMLVVGKLDVKHVEELLQEMKVYVDFAAHNSPTSCTLSGDTDSIKNIKVSLENRFGDGIFLRILDVKVAYHSKYMDPVLQELGDSLDGVFSINAADITTKLVSSVFGEEITQKECSSASYWKSNLRKGVQFHKAFSKALSTTKHNVIVEIGPKPVLRSYIKEIAAETKFTLLASMLDKSGSGQIEQVITQCFQAGVNINWEYYYNLPCPVGVYPRYIYQRKYMYQEPDVAIAWKNGLCAQTDMYGGVTIRTHPFVKDPQKDPTFGLVKCPVKLTSETTPFVFEHKLDGLILAPGATYPEMGIATLTSHLKEPIIPGRDNITVNVRFNRPITVANNKEEREVLVTIFPSKDSHSKEYSYQFDVTSDDILHATGDIVINQKNPCMRSETLDMKDLRKSCTDSFSIDELYSKLEEQKFTYGESLRWGIKGWKNEYENLLQMEVPQNENLRQTILHPVWIDTLFQMFALVKMKPNQEQMIPVCIEKITIFRNQEFIKWAYVKVDSVDNSDIVLNGYLLDNTGGVVVKCEGMKISQLGVESAMKPTDLMVDMSWNHFHHDKLGTSNAGIILFSDSSMVLMNEVKKWKVPLHTVMKNNENVNDITRGNTENCFPQDLSDYEHIIYSWSLDTHLSEEMDGISMTKVVSEECMLLLEIFKIIQDLSKSLTVHVLVNGVYALMNKENISSKQGLLGCLGFAITGMMRTVTCEMTQQEYRIIDIDVNKSKNLDNLQNVIMNPPTESAELAIVKGSLLTCHFQPLSKSVEYNRKSVAYNEAARCVHLARDCDDNITIQAQKCDNSETQISSSNVRVKLQNFFLTSAWQTTKHLPAEIMCMDSHGLTTNGNRVTIFHPVQASTSEINVPSSSCLPFSVFPTDVPCLSFWVCAWNVLQHIQLNSKWEVFAYDKDDPHVMALRCLCAIVSGNENCGLKNAVSVVLCITKAEELENSIQNVLGSNTENVSIITKTSEISKEVLLTHTDQLSHMRHANILSFDSVYTRSLTSATKMFKSWLEKQNFTKLKVALDTYSKMFLKKNPVVTLTDLQEVRATEEDAIVSLSFEENVPLRFNVTTNTLFSKKASYLVFGGSKGLGWETVKHMAAIGAGRIGIVSRSGITRTNWKILHDIENEHKCNFIELTADVTEERQIQNALTKFTSMKPNLPLKGIFFGAVFLQDCTMVNMTSDIFRKVLAPKVTGAWNLLKLSKNFDLDYFVFHSSIISMCGNIGQTNYAAANAFLDGLAHYRRLFHGEGMAICWGALDLGILQHNDIAKRKLAARGMLTLNLEEILQGFDHALLHDPCRVGYSKFNFPRLTKEMWTLPLAGQSLYKWVIENKGHYVTQPSNTSARELIGQAGAATSYVKGLVQSLTMADEEEDIPSDSTLDAIGIDSQQLTIFLSTLVKDHGQLPNINILDLATMSINDIAARLPGSGNKMQEDHISDKKHYSISDDTFNKTDRLPNRSEKADKMKTNHDHISKAIPSKESEYTESSTRYNSINILVEEDKKESNHNYTSKTTTTSKENEYTESSTGYNNMEKRKMKEHKPSQVIPVNVMKQGKYFKAEGEKIKHLQLKAKRDSYTLDVKARGFEAKKIDLNQISNIAITAKKGSNDEDIHEMAIMYIQRTEQLVCIYSENLQLLMDWKESLMSLKINTSEHITFTEAKTCIIL